MLASPAGCLPALLDALDTRAVTLSRFVVLSFCPFDLRVPASVHVFALFVVRVGMEISNNYTCVHTRYTITTSRFPHVT